MDAKRWSPLWVFAGGCLTGVALIAVHAGVSGQPSRSTPRAIDWRELLELSTKASLLDNNSLAQRDDRASAEPSSAPAALGQSRVAAPASSETGTTEPEQTESGHSVGDVLAQLEAEYRKRDAPAPPNQPVTPAATAAPAQKEPADPEQAVAPAPEVRTSDARLALASTDDVQQAPPAAEDATRAASAADAKSEGSDGAQQKVAEQVQQLATLQQATLVEQHALLQYLQLLSLSPASRSSVPVVGTANSARGRSRARGARITAALPSSISDTDNPWGFDLKPATLAR